MLRLPPAASSAASSWLLRARHHHACSGFLAESSSAAGRSRSRRTRKNQNSAGARNYNCSWLPLLPLARRGQPSSTIAVAADPKLGTPHPRASAHVSAWGCILPVAARLVNHGPPGRGDHLSTPLLLLQIRYGAAASASDLCICTHSPAQGHAIHVSVVTRRTTTNPESQAAFLHPSLTHHQSPPSKASRRCSRPTPRGCCRTRTTTRAKRPP